MDAKAQVPVLAKAPSGIATRIFSANFISLTSDKKACLALVMARRAPKTTMAETITVGMIGDAACASGGG
jgi:hypothetical protein